MNLIPQHTPLPWGEHETNDCVNIGNLKLNRRVCMVPIAFDEEEQPIRDPKDKANIEMIIKAVNSYGPMLDALTRILRAHDSGNNGAWMGEAKLCGEFAGGARGGLPAEVLLYGPRGHRESDEKENTMKKNNSAAVDALHAQIKTALVMWEEELATRIGDKDIRVLSPGEENSPEFIFVDVETGALTIQPHEGTIMPEGCSLEQFNMTTAELSIGERVKLFHAIQDKLDGKPDPERPAFEQTSWEPQ